MIREGRQTDIPAMAGIYLEDLKDTYKDLLPASYLESLSMEEARKTWESFLAGGDNRCLVWEEEETVMGFAGIKRDEAREKGAVLSSLYVGREFQGKRIGSSLVEHVLKQAESQGNETVEVCVVMENDRARRLYEHLGAVYEKAVVYHFGEYPVDCGIYLWQIKNAAKKGENK